MVISLKNPVVPEYRATVKLTAVEPEKMTIRNRYQKPLINKENIMYFLGLWALTSVIYLIATI